MGWHSKSRREMAQRWRAALVEGLENERFPGASSLVFEPAFYGHLYNTGGKGTPVAEIEHGFEVELLTELAEQAAPVRETTKVYAPRQVQRLFRRLQSTDFFTGAADRALVRFLKQVHRYFADPELRGGVQRELRMAIGDGAPVVVAHSLGSVAAYELLRGEQDLRVETLVTVGSPLGLRVIRERLSLDGDANRNWPGKVRRWINIAAVEDAIATVKELDGVYGNGIEDRTVFNTRMRAHHCERYLKNVETSRAVAAALS